MNLIEELLIISETNQKIKNIILIKQSIWGLIQCFNLNY